jgi:hypothetical protein
MSEITSPLEPPPGFVPLSSSCAFVNAAGKFYIRSEADKQIVGTWIGSDQADSNGNVDRGFLLTFADFALTEVTNAITIRLCADYVGNAKVGDWIEANIVIRHAPGALIFADAVVAADNSELVRIHGTFLPYKPSAVKIESTSKKE